MKAQLTYCVWRRVMASLYTAAVYWLVHHPRISNYEWNPYLTPGASALFLAVTITTYLTLTFILSLRRPSTIPPAALRLITTVHSLILCLLSLIMSLAAVLSILHQTPHHPPTWPFCFPIGHTPPRGPTFFWGHVFYFSKIFEFIDTLLILLSGSRSRRLSFLHVYHHAGVVVLCYTWLAAPQSLFPVGVVANSAVHSVMYAYYAMCAVGIRPGWKKLVTNFQIIQFVVGYLFLGLMLYHHSSGSGCEGLRSWCFNACFNASLLALFVNFHLSNYAAKKSLVKSS